MLMRETQVTCSDREEVRIESRMGNRIGIVLKMQNFCLGRSQAELNDEFAINFYKSSLCAAINIVRSTVECIL